MHRLALGQDCDPQCSHAILIKVEWYTVHGTQVQDDLILLQVQRELWFSREAVPPQPIFSGSACLSNIIAFVRLVAACHTVGEFVCQLCYELCLSCASVANCTLTSCSFCDLYVICD